MTTAIIGVGKVGSALARNLVGGGERVVLAARDSLTRPRWQTSLAYNDDPDRDGRNAELADETTTTSLPGAAIRPRAHDRPTRLGVATERRRPSARVA